MVKVFLTSILIIVLENVNVYGPFLNVCIVSTYCPFVTFEFIVTNFVKNKNIF